MLLEYSVLFSVIEQRYKHSETSRTDDLSSQEIY